MSVLEEVCVYTGRGVLSILGGVYVYTRGTVHLHWESCVYTERTVCLHWEGCLFTLSKENAYTR